MRNLYRTDGRLVLADSSTIFVISSADSARTYKGIGNVPDIQQTDSSFPMAYAYVNDGNRAELVFVVIEKVR